MKTRNFVSILSGILIIFFLITLGNTTAFSKDQNVKLKQSEVIHWKGQCVFLGSPFEVSKRYVAWIKEKTGGRLVIDLLAPNAIVPIWDQFMATSKGILDFSGIYSPLYHVGIMPEADIENGLPLAWADVQDVWDAFYTRGLAEKFRAIYSKYNIFWLSASCPNQIASVMTTSPIKSISDLKGKKIAGVGIVGEYIKLLGAIPVNIPFVERYQALKLGTVDGVITGATQLEDAKLRDLITHLIIKPNVFPYVNSVLINMDSWNALPNDIKKILEEDSKYWLLSQSLWEGNVARVAVAKGAEYGLTQVELPPDEVKWLTEKTVSDVWSKAAAKSPMCKEMVELVKQQMRDLGRID